MPVTVGEACTELAAPAPALATGLVAAVGCSGLTESGVNAIELYAYDSSASLDSAAAVALQGLYESSCVEQGWGAWTDGNGVERGVLGCKYGEDGETGAAWTYAADAVLVIAWDENVEMSIDDMFAWWQYAAPQLALN